jgi:hypothetical protein
MSHDEKACVNCGEDRSGDDPPTYADPKPFTARYVSSPPDNEPRSSEDPPKGGHICQGSNWGGWDRSTCKRDPDCSKNDGHGDLCMREDGSVILKRRSETAIHGGEDIGRAAKFLDEDRGYHQYSATTLGNLCVLLDEVRADERQRRPTATAIPEPHVTLVEHDGELCFEWWRGVEKFTLYAKPGEVLYTGPSNTPTDATVATLMAWLWETQRRESAQPEGIPGYVSAEAFDLLQKSYDELREEHGDMNVACVKYETEIAALRKVVEAARAVDVQVGSGGAYPTWSGELPEAMLAALTALRDALAGLSSSPDKPGGA